MSEVGKTLLRGHALYSEGATHFGPNGKVDWWGEGSYGRCQCGELFGPGLSVNAVKRAHREHKNALRRQS